MGFVKGGESLEANLGRFWALADDEISVSSVEDEDTITGISRYLVCSPASEGCTLVEAGASALRRREEKKRRQLLAAITLKSGEFFDSVQSDFSAVVNTGLAEENRRSARQFCRHRPFCWIPLMLANGFMYNGDGGWLGWPDR
jgi:hypothetical protein